MPEEDRGIVLALIGVHIILLVVAVLGVPWPDLLLAVGVSATTVAASIVFVDRVRARQEAKRRAPARRAAYNELARIHNELAELWESLLREGKRSAPEDFRKIPTSAVWTLEMAQKLQGISAPLWQKYLDSRCERLRMEMRLTLSVYAHILPPKLLDAAQTLTDRQILWCLDIEFLNALPANGDDIVVKPEQDLQKFFNAVMSFRDELGRFGIDVAADGTNADDLSSLIEAATIAKRLDSI